MADSTDFTDPMLDRLAAQLREEEARARASMARLDAAHEGLTPDQCPMLDRHLIGALTRLVDPDDFAAAVERARAFAVRP